MYILRFLAVLLALIIAFVVSLLSKIDLINIMAIIAFILTVDHIAWTYLSNIYLRAVLGDIEKQTKGDNGDDSSS